MEEKCKDNLNMLHNLSSFFDVPQLCCAQAECGLLVYS